MAAAVIFFSQTVFFFLSLELSTSELMCPLRVNHTNHCQCSTEDPLEIRCRHLDAIPRFTSDHLHRPQRIYAGLYLAAQNIGSLPDWSFENLLVQKIVLNFNPIGDRLGSQYHGVDHQEGDHEERKHLRENRQGEDSQKGTKVFSGLEMVLRELHLGGCRIKTLPPELIVSLVELRVLHLWANHIEAIPSNLFSANRNLRELILWGNDLEDIDSGTFKGLTHLRRLDLDNNNIRRLDKDAFRWMADLEWLHLGRNNIHALFQDTFYHLENLRVLHLGGNGLGYVYGEAFQRLKRLRSLILDDNKITFLPDDVFVRLGRLDTLQLASNRLEYVWARTFAGLKSLRRLTLSGNRLTHLPDGLLHQAPALAHLAVDRNQLRTLHQCIIPRSTQLRSLSYLDNPVECDCRLYWVLLFRLERRGFVWGSCQNIELGHWNTLDDVITSNYTNNGCVLQHCMYTSS